MMFFSRFRRGAIVVDRVNSYFEIRSVSTENGWILLNGRRTFLKMVVDQGYWPERDKLFVEFASWADRSGALTYNHINGGFVMVTLNDARRVIASAGKRALEIGRPMNIAVADATAGEKEGV